MLEFDKGDHCVSSSSIPIWHWSPSIVFFFIYKVDLRSSHYRGLSCCQKVMVNHGRIGSLSVPLCADGGVLGRVNDEILKATSPVQVLF